MTVRYLDPRAEPMKPAEPYELQADLSQPLNIGLLANGFPDSEEFLRAVECACKRDLPQVSFTHFNKRKASVRVPEAMLDDIVTQCGAVIAAYGH